MQYYFHHDGKTFLLNDDDYDTFKGGTFINIGEILN